MDFRNVTPNSIDYNIIDVTISVSIHIYFIYLFIYICVILLDSLTKSKRNYHLYVWWRDTITVQHTSTNSPRDQLMESGLWKMTYLFRQVGQTDLLQMNP